MTEAFSIARKHWLAAVGMGVALVTASACGAGSQPPGVGVMDAGVDASVDSGAPPDLAPPPPPPPVRQALPARATSRHCLPDETYPDLLSESGCFADMATQTPAPDLIPYDVASPLWTDGALKSRWISVPPGQRVNVLADGQWDFPVGTVLVKNFALAGAVGRENPTIVETRLMLRTPSGWSFAGYQWNEAGTEATRVTQAHREAIDIIAESGERQTVSYLFPAERDCTTCHSSAVNQAFGPSANQMAMLIDYAGHVQDQLTAFADLDLFASQPAMPERRMVDPMDKSAPLEDRARSWLHANCSHCHQPGGWAPPEMNMDLRFDVPLADARICNVRTQYLVSIPRIKPGDPDGSAIWKRISTDGISRMPPVGLSLHDPAEDVVRQWIESLSDCPEPAP